MGVKHLHLLAATAALVVTPAGPAISGDAGTEPTPQIRYVDFPSRIDPGGTHKHVPLTVGSRLYGRRQIVVHQLLTDRQGRPLDDAYVVDAASTITQTGGKATIVEPDGRTWQFSRPIRVDRTVPSWRHIVVRAGEAVPKYLVPQAPDIEVAP